MRWVLGEQSARQLRGARMDDVIFAGNAGRRPLGMAEVTLTFDNSDGALSTPFSEVAITRRAYRTGESEFFLNKSQVRLRDITDLLLGTGLAAELAAIVSQGEIDAILSAKPEARRELFEGVAGTARYRLRKREAQRRLEQTAANALRLNDILSELEKQMPAIEQQVRRAKRYQRAQQQLRDFEILSYVRKTAQRRAERATIVNSLGSDENEAGRAAKQYADLKAALNQARYDEYQASLAVDDRSAAHTKLAQELQTQATAHAAQSAKMAELARSCESLEREVDGAATAAAQADAKLSASSGELGSSRQARDEALSKAEAAAAAESQKTATWEQAYASLRAVEDARTREVAKFTESNSAQASAQVESERLTQAAGQLETEIEAARSQAREAASRLTQARADLELIARESAANADAKARAATMIENATKTLDEQRRLRDDARVRLLQTKARFDAYKQLEGEAKGAPAGVRVLLEAASSGELHGVIGRIADLIKVDDRYAVALEALLGACAHDVVVRTLDDATAALQVLKRKQSGRATIVALDSLSTVVSTSHGSGQGVVGRAVDLIACEPALKPALERALGDSFIVSTLDDALAGAKRLPDACFATLEGDVIRSGVISTGTALGPVSMHAVLSQLEREIHSGERALGQGESAVKDAEQDAVALQNRLEQIRSNAATLVMRQHDAKLLREQSERDQHTGEHRLRSLIGQHDETAAKAVAARSAKQGHAEQAADLGQQVEALEARRRDASAAADALAAELATVRAHHRSAAANAAALVERVAQLSDDVQNARNDLEKAQIQRKERLASLAGMREEHKGTVVEVSRLESARASAEQTLAAAAADVAQLRESRDARAQQTRELEAAYAQEEQKGREQSLELERLRIRLAEIDAELALLAETFSQNPATQAECDEVDNRYKDYDGDADASVRRLREELVRLGNVNLNALEDRAAALERCEFLRSQLRDLEAARADIVSSIAAMDAESLRQFNETFEKVSVAFSETFTRLFNGGNAKIWVSEAEDPTEAGIEISAQPPGKKMQNLNLLSGGERALTAVALIFATLQVRPSPFYIFDEIDAALDEANVGRFGLQLAELAGQGRSQIIIITHNKATMTLVDRMYGVTMSEAGVSNVLSLSLERAGAAR